MPLQILTLKLDGVTAGDYLTWCRDPDPPALDFSLRSISIDADPLGDTITAILNWNDLLPPAAAAAAAAGLPLTAGVRIHRSLTDRSHARLASGDGSPRLTRVNADAGAGRVGSRPAVPCAAGVEGHLRTAI